MVWLPARITSNKVVGEIEIWVSAEHVVGVWGESWARTEPCRASWAPHGHSLALGSGSALLEAGPCPGPAPSDVTPAERPKCFPLQDLVPPGAPAGKVNEFWPGQPKSCE